MKHATTILVLLGMLLIAACATPMKMGLTKATDQIDLNNKTLLLLCVELVNEYKPSYQPEAFVLYLEKPDARQKEDRLNFTADEEGTLKSDSGNKYVFRMMVEEGQYIIRGILGFSGRFPVSGSFFMPLHSEVEIEGSSVLYLGRVIGIVRERKDNEFRAGAVIPLIDQAVTGFSGGTFDVNIVDNFEEDLKYMTSIFPSLARVEVKSKVVPAFDRAKAQKWWEDH